MPVPVSLLISVAFLIRPLWQAVPLRACPMPFVFFGSFWASEDHSDYTRAQLIEFLRILSGISSGSFSALLWLQLSVATGHSIPAFAAPSVFCALGILLIATGIRQYRRLQPSRWGPEDV
ncbi:hypothetical protein [Brevibacterium renqingii]|uniref:hypothetical protein n=1 Tax=Brevibacterium renqingii TaxID=2776916 RepID=UPI001ADFC379|nr:hypothetical protein [Brevibacterium renqingii]